MTYLKITNAKENHFGLQYHDGLVKDIVPFDTKESYCPGGIYFTTPDHICEFLYFGENVREVTVPEDAQMVECFIRGMFRASAVVLGPKRSLSEVSTWEWLISLGSDIRICDNFAVKVCSRYGYLEVVKYLVSVGADIHAENDYAVRWASHCGHLEVVKYLVSIGANINVYDGEALRFASNHAHLNIVEYIKSLD
jgi:ankyrin repeat protein